MNKATEMAVGAIGGAIASELLKIVIGEAKKVLSFETVYKELASTMEQLLPIIRVIEASQDVKELKTLRDTIDKARVLVRGCSAVKKWNAFLKSYYIREVERINKKMFKFCQIHLPLLLLRSQGESTLKIEAINTYIQIINQLLLDLPTVHPPDLSYLSSVPKLDNVPVGLDWPLRELKKKLLDDSVNSVVVSASPGCGKTRLVTQLCYDADIKENGEPLQILHYENGQKYDPHYDFFYDQKALKIGGHRIATVLMYLSNVKKGGETVFPMWKGNTTQLKDDSWSECAKQSYAVKPRKGDGLLFFNLHPNATTDPTSLHGSCPVIEGEKWSATRWIHVRSFGRSFKKQSECVDEDESCETWANNGECEKNPTYMVGSETDHGYCRKSCKACSS